MKDKFLELWQSSAIIQGSLALMMGATICYLSIAQIDCPDVLIGMLGTIIGFYFGTKRTLANP